MTMNYQDRYLAHQERKKNQLESQTIEDSIPSDSFSDIVSNRKSSRIFSTQKIEREQIDDLLSIAYRSPSSCNRQAVFCEVIEAPESLDDLLVGGKGWIGKSSHVILLFADMEAYKSPNEVLFMPYLDAGVKAMMICLGAESLGIKNCIVNPNIRPENELMFRKLYNAEGHKFCLAIALGL